MGGSVTGREGAGTGEVGERGGGRAAVHGQGKKGN